MLHEVNVYQRTLWLNRIWFWFLCTYDIFLLISRLSIFKRKPFICSLIRLYNVTMTSRNLYNAMSFGQIQHIHPPPEKMRAFVLCLLFFGIHPPSTRSVTSDSQDLSEPDGHISEKTLQVDEVFQSLTNLDISKAPGPDGIPSRLLQACSLEIAPSICEPFNHSLHTGHISSEWKSANVTHVYNKERKELAENYRPISLLPILSKVLERCVCLKLYTNGNICWETLARTNLKVLSIFAL